MLHEVVYICSYDETDKNHFRKQHKSSKNNQPGTKFIAEFDRVKSKQMKKIVILGGGTAGTLMLNKLNRKLDNKEFEITIVDQDEVHYYQPGFLFIPFGTYQPEDVIRPRQNFFPDDASVVISKIDKIEPEQNKVLLQNGESLDYDWLIIATGSQIRPDETEGMDGKLWHKKIFDFYTYEGTTALAKYLDTWEGGAMLINIVEMPIKCPVAPLEFAFLADAYFTQKGIRDKVDIKYVTPMSGAFTKPKASTLLGDFLERKHIELVPDFAAGSVDNETQELVSWDDRREKFDLLVTIPLHMGDTCIEKSGMGDDLNFVPTDKHTLKALDYDNIFVIGDATDVPASKAGSVAHFEADILEKNLLAAIEGKEMTAKFDGHANCYVESGFGKAILIDFNYDVEPLPGKFPMPGVGPFSLLKETRLNHMGKLAFRWIYWNMLLKGREIPTVGSHMRMAGKVTE